MKKLAVIATTVAGSGIMVMSGLGIASAAPSSTGNIGTSGISRSVFRQERLDAVAEVLNTTTASVQNAHKNKTLDTLIKNAGLTRTTFRQKVRAQLVSDLEAKGYTQDQITIALQHRTIVRLRHKDR